jgi:hypothetical protein
MNTTINSRAAIQARIAEWQRQYRDYAPNDVLFGLPKAQAGQIRWFRQA